MGWMAAATIGSALLGSRSSENAADTAAQASREASAASVAEQQRQYDTSRADYAPYLAAGTESVNQLAAGLRPGGRFASTTPFDFRYDKNTDPGYGFSFDQTMRGINASMAAKGMGGSGAGIKGAADLASNLSNRYYGDAFNRALTTFNANTGERNQLYNRLAGVAGTGQNAVGSVTAQGANMANNVGNAYMTGAANTGNAAMAAAGARQSAFGGAANALGRMYGRGGFSNSFGGANPYDVYGPGGGGYMPSQDQINAAFANEG